MSLKTQAVETPQYRPEYRRELPHFDRVRNHTSPRVNRRIDEETERRLQRYKAFDTGAIEHRLVELDKEWDVDRALMAAFALLGGASFVAGIKVNRKFHAFLGAQFSFLLYHAIQGWCPPMAVLRRLGFRTVREIDAEKAALRALQRTL